MSLDHMSLVFDLVTPSEEQIMTLFGLLKQREHVISHTELPTYEQHKKFVELNNYRAWYIVFFNNIAIGSFYISNENTVGINISHDGIEISLQRIIDYVLNNYQPLPEIKSVRGSKFVINVAPTNVSLRSALRRQGKKIIQIIYSLE